MWLEIPVPLIDIPACSSHKEYKVNAYKEGHVCPCNITFHLQNYQRDFDELL